MSWKYIFKVGDNEIEFVAGSESYLNDQLELVTRETCQKEKNKIIVSISGSDILRPLIGSFSRSSYFIGRDYNLKVQTVE